MLLCHLLASLLCVAPFVEVPNENLVEIMSPDMQEVEVAKIRLENGLEAYIISDPDARQSAAALSVEAASWLDDPKYPGIAHFLEHLLFLGTEKYPGEGEYPEYLDINGGSSNAYTAQNNTCYALSVNNDAFNQAIDRFADFFISPLFTPSGVGRELKAVDHENAGLVENDFWRFWMVFKETGNPESPNAPFYVGNRETLGNIPPETVRGWWQKHYSADCMHVCVYSNLPMDELKQLIADKFSPIEKRCVENELADEPLLSEEQQNHITYIEPVRDVRKLALVWEIPEWSLQDLSGKLHQQLAYVLCNSSENSLETFLKKEGLAEGVYCDPQRFSKRKGLFFMWIELTSEGVRRREDVIRICFEALAELRENGIPQHVFNDVQTMALTNYQWQTRGNPFQMVMNFAGGPMIYEPLQTVPAQHRFFTEYEPEKMQRLLNSMTQDNCAISIAAPAELTGVEYDRQERWYGASYVMVPREFAEVQPHPTISSPRANPYIPKNIGILDKEEMAEPLKIIHDEMGTAYYTPANDFNCPDVRWIIGIRTPAIDGTPKQTALLSLYQRAFNEKLASMYFFAGTAGISASISAGDLALFLNVSGYSNAAPRVLKKLVESLKNVQPTAEEFAIYKESLLTDCQNAIIAPPIDQVFSAASLVLMSHTPDSDEVDEALEELTHEDFLAYTEHLFDKVYLECLFAGNLTKKQAKKIWHLLECELQAQPYSNPQRKEGRVLGENGPFIIRGETAIQGNAALLSIQQGTVTHKTKAAQLILDTVLSSTFFTELRTNQQTGYKVNGFADQTVKQLAQYFVVESSDYSPDDLLSRYELFLSNFLENFDEEFSEERFEEVRSGVVTTLSIPHPNLRSATSEQYYLAYTEEGNFAYRDELIRATQEISYEEIKEYAMLFFSPANKRRIAFLLHGAPAQNAFGYTEATVDDIFESSSFN